LAPSPGTPPEAVAQAFYDWYISYGGNPLTTGAYRASSYLTPEFVQRVDKSLASSTPGIAADPFICAQNPPSSFTTGTASVSGDRASLVVQMFYSGNNTPNNLTLSMVRVGGQWKIDDVKCPASPARPVGTAVP
jgi:hypothetical protein